jgi:very-short-patch-repair endonuclease
MAHGVNEVEPLPLEGGGAGVGVEVPASGTASDEPATAIACTAATPIPGPSPLQGEGRRPVPAAKARALRLRKAETYGERIVWKALRERKMNFRRQAPVGPYVVDFAHFGSRLVIEIDGYHHTLPDRQARDAERDAWFRAEGFRVLRFPESDVKSNLTSVVEQIVAETAPPPSPALPPSRGKGAPRYDVR